MRLARRAANAATLVTALLATVVTTLVARPAPAEAAATHVGLVVRYANGSVATACASAGGSGLAVLERKFSVMIGQQPPYAGFVFTIDGTGSTHPDTTHYWSYWHGASGGGGWTYSSTGAGSYTPKAGTVEGWSYVNGSSTATRPPAYTYAALCASSDPKPAPTTRHTSPTSGALAGGSTSARRTQSAHTAAPSGSATRLTTRRGGSSASGAPSTADSTAGSTAGSTAVSTPAASPAPSTPVPSPTTSPVGATRHGSGGVPAWTTVLAIVVVAGLGSFAALRSRRAR